MTRHLVSFFSSPRQCPSCGGNHIRRSRRKGLTEYLLALGLLRPFRCRDCDERHYAFVFRKRNEPSEPNAPSPNLSSPNLSSNDGRQLQLEFPK